MLRSVGHGTCSVPKPPDSQVGAAAEREGDVDSLKLILFLLLAPDPDSLAPKH